MRYSLTREVFEYIKQELSEGVLGVELEEELGLSAAYILQLDKYATWEEVETERAKKAAAWHAHPEWLVRRRLRKASLRKTKSEPKPPKLPPPPKLPVYCEACGKLVEYAYWCSRKRYCSEECRKEDRRAYERERYHRRMRNPEYVAKEKIRQHEKWLRMKKKKEEAK